MPKPLPLALRSLRFFYRYFSPIVPGLGVRLMWRAFQPRRRPVRAEAVQFLAGAELFSFPSASALIGETLQLQGYRWGSVPRTVLLVHGWEGSPADFRELVPALLARGYAVAAFDLPAHGHSEGRETNLVEMRQALVNYTAWAGLPYAVVAHSLGGTAAALLLKDATTPVEKFVFVASPLSARDTFEVLFAPLQVPVSVQERFYQRLARHLQQPVEDIAFASAARLGAHRCLGVYDTADEQVVFARVQRYLAANAGIKSQVVSGVGHTRLLRHPPVVQRIVDFLDA